MRPRLYLDADVVPGLPRLLRDAKYDAVRAHELGLLHLTDEKQLARASAEGRAILTFNYQDFLVLSEDWFLAGRPHAGIIISYRQYGREQLGSLRVPVLALLNQFSAEQLASTLRVLDDFRQR
ncbi:MAG: DUF5615 family PIN-like protein [Chloroflexi bacterium]|nr:DUF5615 family PIN-like protein [Chloroflexota bacterium]